MNALMISTNPQKFESKASITAYNQAGFMVDLVSSSGEALNKTKNKKYNLLIIERSSKEDLSDIILFTVMQAIAQNNPDAKVISQGWKSTGLHFYIIRDYSADEHEQWVEFLSNIYNDLNKYGLN